jgi:hypothetical protein
MDVRVEVLEYGGDPEMEYPEHWNSFKIMTVWSEPEMESVGHIPHTAVVYESPERSPLESRRLAVAVEFSMDEGGYLFVESPGPDPGWLNRVFDALREEGWQGFNFRQLRIDCRGDIEVLEEEEFTAVIDTREGRVFHNRGVQRGSGVVEDLSEWTG